MAGERTPAAAIMDGIHVGRFPWWFPLEARQLAFDYFAYGTDFVPLGASATATQSINILSDSAFFITSAVLVETDVTGLIFLAQAPLLAQLNDTGSGRSFSNTPIHVSNWFGTAEEPKLWDVPKLLSPGATFQVTLQNLEAVARHVRIAFHGFKIFGWRPR